MIQIIRTMPGSQRSHETQGSQGPDEDAATQEELVWSVDARQNIYFAGPFPVFYWPRVAMDLDDLEPPLRMIGFAKNNYFGYQFKADFNGFRLIQQAPAQVHRPLERRRRLPECADRAISRRLEARWVGSGPISCKT